MALLMPETAPVGWVGWTIAAAADSVAGNEERESQEIFPPTTLLFSAGTAARLVWIKY